VAVWKYKGDIPFCKDWGESSIWWISTIIRNCIYEIHRDDIGLFYKWLLNENENIPQIIIEADFAINRLKEQDQYIERFTRDFNRATKAADYIKDPLVPRGEVHYFIFYQFCQSKGIFVSERVKANYGKPKHKLWFDYYGVEEDERGLIVHLDY